MSKGHRTAELFPQPDVGTTAAPVECVGMTFHFDDARRAHFPEKPGELRKRPDAPLAQDEDIHGLSDPAYHTACPNPFLREFVQRYGRRYEQCRTWGVGAPRFDLVIGALRLRFPAPVGPTAEIGAQVTAQVAAMLQAAAHLPVSRETLHEATGIKHREHLRKAYLEPALNAGLLEMTIPDTTRSSKQTYRVTNAGRRVLEQAREQE